MIASGRVLSKDQRLEGKLHCVFVAHRNPINKFGDHQSLELDHRSGERTLVLTAQTTRRFAKLV